MRESVGNMLDTLDKYWTLKLVPYKYTSNRLLGKETRQERTVIPRSYWKLMDNLEQDALNRMDILRSVGCFRPLALNIEIEL